MKEFLAAHIIEVISIVSGVVIAVVVPLLLGRRQRKITGQNRNLRAHFKELKREAEPVISFARGLSNRYGKIVPHEKSVVSIF